MAPATQVKVLRVLEDRTFFRVGGTQPIKVDLRVIAATNKSLKEEVALGRFRDDLYYRLNVLAIYLPPLRERKIDIPLLVRRFIAEFAATHDRSFRGITPPGRWGRGGSAPARPAPRRCRWRSSGRAKRRAGWCTVRG